MKEYEQITISSNDNLADLIREMRRFGWVYVDSNAVGFTDHYVTGAVINGYGGFTHHNDHYVDVNVRFVRDDTMPHYQELKELYIKHKRLRSIVLKEPKSMISAKFAFFLFVILGIVLIIISSTNNPGSTFSIVCLVIGIIVTLIFSISLFTQSYRLKKARDKYDADYKEASQLTKEIYTKIKELEENTEIAAFLDNLEKNR